MSDGSTVYAVLYDAEGNVKANIADASLIGLIDVSERNAIANGAIAERLNNAYLGVMYDVNYSDVEAAKHDDVLKIDINQALIAAQLTAHDLVMCELFDVELYGEYSDELAAGSMELTLGLEVWQGAPIIVVTTQDGIEWSILSDVKNNGDGTVTIRVQDAGVIAFLLGKDDTQESGEGYVNEVVVTEKPAQPSEDQGHFTPSVSGKPAPSLVGSVGENEEIYSGYIVHMVSGSKTPVPNEGYLIVTPLAERDYIADIQTHEHLEWAYDEILNAETLGELSATGHEMGLAADIDQRLAEMNAGLTHKDMIVRDLFEVSVYGKYLDYFYDENNRAELVFDAGIAQGASLIVAVSGDSATWHILPQEDVVVDGEGMVTVRMHELGTVAFLVDAATTLQTTGGAVVSPATGD